MANATYLLLRNNREEGPFSLDGILQKTLLKTDLVWVEGRSAAWRFPYEVETLRPFLPHLAPDQPEIASDRFNHNMSVPHSSSAVNDGHSRVFVSMPQRCTSGQLQESKPAQPVSKPVEEQVVNEIRLEKTLENSSKEYGGWLLTAKQKQREKEKKRGVFILTACTSLALLAFLFFRKSGSEEHAIQAPVVAAKMPVQAEPDSAPDLAFEEPNVSSSSVPMPAPVRSKSLPGNASKYKEVSHGVRQVKQDVLPPVTTEAELEITVPQSRTAAAPAPEQLARKTFKTKLKELFSRKDQTASQEKEETPPPATDRVARKKAANAAEKATTPSRDLSIIFEKVNLSYSVTEDWMMGINGLKITVKNRNDIALSGTVINVLYFDEKNNLVEKKSVRTGRVPANGSVTVKGMDHPVAYHILLELAEAQVKDERYAYNK